MSTAPDRHVIHVDMDAFYAAIEQRDHPELRGKPVLVGGDPRGRGVVSTASYEARPYGCHSAMPMATAVRLCPQAVVIRPRMERYVEVSRRVFAILEEFTPLVEPLSIDEAFLDVTGTTRLFGSPVTIAQTLKRRIHEETELTGSTGVAPNKFLAKLASDLEKPDGLVVVGEDEVQAFLDPLPISRLWGVGKATLPKLERLGVHTFGDLRRLSAEELRDRFGESGDHFYRLVRGIDDRPVVPDREAKSISHEVTFPTDVSDRAYLRSILLDQVEHVARRLRRHRQFGRTVTVKIRAGDFTTITRSATLPEPTDCTDTLWEATAALFDEWLRKRRYPVRLIGMGVSHLSPQVGRQLQLFEGAPAASRLDQTVDRILDRFGNGAIHRGCGRSRGSER